VAFGGFITAGFTLVAFCHRIAVILHESNRKPGRAIRLLSPLANRLYLPEGVSLNGVPPQVTRHFGFPLRRNLQLIPRDRARKKLGIDNSGKFVVVLGGSQGSQALNDWFSDHLESLAHEGINVYCLTGLGKGESGETKFTSAHGRRVKGIRRTFTDRMGELLSAADLVVSRAGAGTIAEIAHCRVPSILVPFPYAADGHQLANARFLECQGGCIVVEESHIGELHSEVMDLIFNDWTLAKFRHNLTNLERGDYCERIVRDIEQIVIDRQNALTTPHRRTQVPA
jgi:UDP-N-acetylglucosamine--N-acetylmuramyl-(pentapeptide) pyrophosphoryl-undecaprenol N-acetylglucosamine transferase